jgi:hypothetical protein
VVIDAVPIVPSMMFPPISLSTNHVTSTSVGFLERAKFEGDVLEDAPVDWTVNVICPPTGSA